MDVRASFRIGGPPGLTAAAVTQRLGIQPSQSLEEGTPVSRRSPRALRDSSLWVLSSSPEIESGGEIADHLLRLLEILEPATKALWELSDAGYLMDWFCYIASHPFEHAAELDRSLLQRITALPAEIWLDVCGLDDEEYARQAGRERQASGIS